MYAHINYNESIRQEKVCYSKGSILELVASLPMHVTLVLIGPILLVIGIKNCINNFTPELVGLLFWILLLAIFSFLVLFKWINIDQLKRVKGISGSINHQAVQNIFIKRKWNCHFNQPHMIIAYQGPDSNKERQLVILFNGDDILINVTGLTITDTKNALRFMGDYNTRQEFCEEFRKELKNSPHNTVQPSP